MSGATADTRTVLNEAISLAYQQSPAGVAPAIVARVVFDSLGTHRDPCLLLLLTSTCRRRKPRLSNAPDPRQAMLDFSTPPPPPADARTTRLVEDYAGWARTIAAQALRRLPPTADSDDAEAVALETLWKVAQKFRDDYQLLGYDKPVSFEAYARQKIYWAVLRAFSRRRWAEDRHEALDERMPAPSAITDNFEMLVSLAEPGLERRVLVGVYQMGQTLSELAIKEGVLLYKIELTHRGLLARLRDRLKAGGVRRVADVMEV